MAKLNWGSVAKGKLAAKDHEPLVFPSTKYGRLADHEVTPRFKKRDGKWYVYGTYSSLKANAKVDVLKRDGTTTNVTIAYVTDVEYENTGLMAYGRVKR